MKRDAPAARRNLAPIRQALVMLLGDHDGDLLEIGSGTGQHAAGIAPALPRLRWWPTDPDPASLGSVDAYRRDAEAPNLAPPCRLDASGDWQLGGPDRPPTPLAAVFCANVIHIAPWAVAEGLLRGAGEHLAGRGQLVLYGPFAEEGRFGAESNAAFDAELRRRDPRWGVRDLADLGRLAEVHGLRRARRIEMPANNAIVVFERAD